MDDDLHAPENLEGEVASFQRQFSELQAELARVIVGNEEVVRATLTAIFAGGHVLLEGVPGLGKTLLVKSLAKVLGIAFRRVQFTPDLMPSDITGTQVLSDDDDGKRNFAFKPGSLFANIVLADEINRATPKTQSALLEAMEERQVSVLGKTYRLPNPFFVLATQNPVELEGTYPLPEAQLDRFLFKIIVYPPSSSELKEILQRTTGAKTPQVSPVLVAEEAGDIISAMKRLVRQVYVADPLHDIIVRIMAAVTPTSDYATPKVKEYVRFGPGPRGAQAVMMAGKVNALLDGRVTLSFEDVRQVLKPALRHRLILNFQAEANEVDADSILEEVANAK